MKGTDYVEEYVNSLVDYNLPLNIRLESIIQATKDDPVLTKLNELLSSDFWDDDDKRLKPYFNIRSELSISSDGLILYGNRIVIPTKLQPELIKIAHQSHQGKEKTKQLLNQFVWFADLSTKVDSFIDNCHTCNSNSEKKEFQPLTMSPMPNGVWEQLATDFHGPLPSGDYLMLITDEFSRFPISKSLKSSNADNVIKIWKETFQIFGYPKEIKTDNGPPFQSYKVRKFMLDNNIKH